MKTVRRPRIDLDALGRVATHGFHVPRRGIWHSTESSDYAGIRDLEGIVAYWGRQGRGLGSHVIIDKAGNSALCVPPGKIAWHVGGRNTGSVGIELIGFARFTPTLWFVRRAQLDKLARWMAWLDFFYGIPLRFGVERGWSGHGGQPNQTHWDPGPWFPKKYVLRLACRYRENGW